MGLKKRLEHLLKHNKFVQTVYRYTMSGVFKFIGLFVRTDKKLVLMNGHGWRFNDSPRAIYDKMKELGMLEEYHVVWALKEPEKYDIPDAKKVKMDSFKYFITALKAKYWISCVNIERALHFKKKKTVYLNTWHGASVAFVGNAVSGRNDFHFEHVNYFCLNGEYERDFIIRDFNVLPEALIPTGYPRNDELYYVTPEKKRAIREKLGIPEGKKVILYAPTWRDSNDGGASYQLAPPINWAKWKEKLGEDYLVLLRTHPYTTKLMNVEFDEFVWNCIEYPSVNELMMAADVLISDYSCILLDYAILEKPLICFGYDYEEYRDIHGFYFDMREVIPNGVMETEDQIIEHLTAMDYEAECAKTKALKESHMEYGGKATITCINKVFGTNYEA